MDEQQLTDLGEPPVLLELPEQAQPWVTGEAGVWLGKEGEDK